MTILVKTVGKVQQTALYDENLRLGAENARLLAQNEMLLAELADLRQRFDALERSNADLGFRVTLLELSLRVQPLNSLELLEKYLETQETTLIGFFDGNSALKSTFLNYADEKQRVRSNREKQRFGHTSAADALEKYGLTDGIILFRAQKYSNKFEDDFVKFEGEGIEDLTTFVKDNIHGLVGHRTLDNFAEFKTPFVIAYYAVDYINRPKTTQYWRKQILKVVKDLTFTGKYSFAIANKDDFQHELNEYGYIYTGDRPVVLARDELNKKYTMNEEFTTENLKTFFDDLILENLQPYLKSEPVPEDNNGPVKIAVAKNFEDLIINNGKDTLIEFYAPGQLTPAYDELGGKLANEDVVIAKFDATANDVPPEFEVVGHPTLFWLPKDSKSKPVKYEGGREVDDFLNYIAEHATKELKGFNRAGKPKKVEL